MKQDATIQTRGGRSVSGTITKLARRLVPVAVFFAIAFAIDMLTGQRYSSLWGSAAIIASVVYVFPAVRPTLAAFAVYGAIWVGFNLVRAIADDAGLALASTTAISRWERDLFGGFPSAQLQAKFLDVGMVQAQDVVLSLVHGSFFIVPFIVAALVWWRARALFQPFAVATALTFALGLIGFLLLPTAPPWMSDPGDVTRITPRVLAEVIGVPLGGGSAGTVPEGFRFEPNHLAAMPSVHVSATVLVFLTLTRFGRIAGVIGGLYALLMSVGVVYLGEHFVLDAIAGWITALIGWELALRWCGEKRFGTERNPVVR